MRHINNEGDKNMFKACFNWIATKLKYLCCCFKPTSKPEYQYTSMTMVTSGKGSSNKGKNTEKEQFYIGTQTQKKVKTALKKSEERRKQEGSATKVKNALFSIVSSNSEGTAHDGCSAQELLEKEQKKAANSVLNAGKWKKKAKDVKNKLAQGGEIKVTLPGMKKKVGLTIN